MPARPALRRALLHWFDRHQRDLPWRRTRDPYAIWISETMLQQTRVETAIGYYQRFLERFPTLGSLAAAPLADVLAAWAGLGYYRRARMLHEAARRLAQDGNAKIPRDPRALRALPGVGAYTAGAVASIAFGERVAAVDGNVNRVVARWLGLRGDPRAGNTKKTIEGEAAALVAECERPGDWNQSLMELGATVCLPNHPECGRCPVARRCVARAEGTAAEIPPVRKRREAVRVRHAAAVVERGGKYLWVRRAEGGLLAGLYEFPTLELAGTGPAPPRLADFVRERTGFEVEVGGPVAQIQHSITHRRIEVAAFAAHAARGRAKSDTVWLAPDRARLRGLTAAARKILDRLAPRATRAAATNNPTTN